MNISMKFLERYIDLPKDLTYDQIVVSRSMVLFYVAIYCVVAPLALIITGFVILILRRRK